MDKNVRIGKLDNGLTYYIRHNARPEKRVEFYIAQKVGSILEEPQQRGLAHFLEHMAFNGTKNFPGDETGLGIVPWCETKGIKFGTNLNAYTAVDQTVYNISNVPTDNINVVDSCLLILHDWSSAIKLADKENRQGTRCDSRRMEKPQQRYAPHHDRCASHAVSRFQVCRLYADR